MMRNVDISDFEGIYKLETAGFPAGVADSQEVVRRRLRDAGGLTVGYYKDGELVGFISGTRYGGHTITRECMQTHEPNGRNICVHSVAVDQQHRRKGIATAMVKNYISTVQVEQSQAEMILLLSKPDTIPMYTRLGFVVRGVSDIVLGEEPWYEMEYGLDKQINQARVE